MAPVLRNVGICRLHPLMADFRVQLDLFASDGAVVQSCPNITNSTLLDAISPDC